MRQIASANAPEKSLARHPMHQRNQATPPKVRFKANLFTRIVLLITVIATVGSAYIKYRVSFTDAGNYGASYFIGQATGAVVFSFAVPYLLAVLAYSISGRRNGVGNVVMSVLLILSAFANLRMISPEDLRTFKALGQQEQATKPVAEKTSESKTMAANLHKARKDFEAPANHCLTPPDFTDVSQIQQARNYSQQYLAAAQAMYAYSKNFENHVTELAREKGATPQEAQRIYRNMTTSGAVEILTHQQQYAVQYHLAKNTDELLGLLQSQWGHWSYSPDSGKIFFEDKEAEKLFAELNDKQYQQYKNLQQLSRDS
jgi:hypothetical protein